MLDGLDEVADVDLRDQVINAISALASKLSVWKADAQLIVTSRPSTSQRTSILAKAGFNRVALTWSVPDFIDTGLSCQVG